MAIIPIFIPHAGCPHQCVFCNQKTISGQKTAALEGAREQLAQWQTYVKPDVKHEVAFFGGSFTALDLALQEQLLALTDELLTDGYIGSVRCSTRPDAIDEERMALLKKHHVTTVELGVQSLDDVVLLAAERGHTAQQSVEAIRKLKSNHFTVGVQLMAGLPKQDFASFRLTIEMVVELKDCIDIARLYPVLVIKNTPLAEQYYSGKYTPLALEEAVDWCAYAYSALKAAGIRVIRTGLQADGELCSPGNIVAGPWHPSMGELVKSCIWRNKLTPQLDAFVEAHSECKVMCIRCNPKLESQVRGMKNANLKFWQERYAGVEVRILHDSSASVYVIDSQ